MQSCDRSSSNQKPMDRTKIEQHIYLFFDNRFLFDTVHQNIE